MAILTDHLVRQGTYLKRRLWHIMAKHRPEAKRFQRTRHEWLLCRCPAGATAPAPEINEQHEHNNGRG